MKKEKKQYEYIWLHWTPIALLFSAIMILVIETAIQETPGKYWNWALYLNIPFLIVILVMLLSPLVEGIIALIMAPVWIISWIYIAGFQGGGGSITEFAYQGLLSALAVILAIAFHWLNSNRPSKEA